MLMQSFVRHKKAWIGTFIAAGAALVILTVFIASAIPLRSDILKQRIVDTLSTRLNSNVTLDDLSLRVFPRLHVEGRGLTLRDRRRPHVPPLIAVRSFTVDGDIIGVWRKRVGHVVLSGLDISIPPDDDNDIDRRPHGDHRLHAGGKAISTSGDDAGAKQRDKPRTTPNAIEDGVVIDTLVTEDAQLIVIPKSIGKAPKIWAIHALTMHDVGVTKSMPFNATLTNGVPPGEIYTDGRFGPWNADNPGDTPLQGTFAFDRADLSVFHGISGTLASRGSFGGALNYIDVHGETETPDFVIEVGGHPFPLATTYHAIVDGTNGDTLLEQIDAKFLNSTLLAKGAVLDGPPGEHGRTVSLDVTMTKARIEDLMRMAVKQSTPPMIGALQLTTKFLLPPGETDVSERLRLNGRFSMSNAKFTNREVQAKIVELSHRGRGKDLAVSREPIASDFKGQFILGNGRLQLKDLRFAVPGAQVRLAGVYVLKPETLAFKGDLLMDAKVSQTVSGWKSLLLKIADPIFRKNGGGSSVPIKIEGSRNAPKFGLDMGRVFRRSD
jgi:hypothetical protein